MRDDVRDDGPAGTPDDPLERGPRLPGTPGGAPDDAPDGAPVVPPSVPVAEALGLTPASEVARAALERARAAARARGARPGRPTRSSGRAGEPRTSGGPAAGASGRDPVLLGDTLARLAAERAWVAPLSVGGVIGRWREVVGDQVADHCEPESFDEGVLVVRADSTSWAANLRLLTSDLLARLAAEVGEGVVAEVRVLGPSGPRWAKGPRTVRGRGPRDTYG